MNIDTIVNAYMEAAIWADGNSDADFSMDEKFQVWQEVMSFVELAGARLKGIDDEMIGHDFYLTRNHHGAGFWDRGLGERGESLTKLAHTFGETDYEFQYEIGVK